MKRWIAAALIGAAAVTLAGCADRAPRAVVPVDRHDFGDVPVVSDMRNALIKGFAVQNEGTADLRLRDIQVKLLEGC